MNGHPDRETIFAYVDNSDENDREAVARHIADCPECRRIMVEAQSVFLLLSDQDVLGYLATPDHQRDDLRDGLLTELQRVQEERASAGGALDALHAQPIEAWEAWLDLHRSTARSVRRSGSSPRWRSSSIDGRRTRSG